MGEEFDPDQDKIQGYAKDAVDPFSTAVVEDSVTLHCDSCDGENIPQAFMHETVLVHGASGIPDQAGLVLGSGCRSGGWQA